MPHALLIICIISCLILTSMAATFNVTRIFNGGDVFNTLTDDSKCDPKNCAMYRATSTRSSPCYCQCPLAKPAFLQHMKRCSDSIDDCKMVEFNNHNQGQGQKLRIPTVFIPLTGQILNPNGAPDWQSAGVKVDYQGNVPCTVFTVGYLSKDGWTPMDNTEPLFSLLNDDGSTFLQWLGSKREQSQLTGKIVQVSLQCENSTLPEFCSVFRVVGNDVSSLSVDHARHSDSNQPNQWGLIVGIVCGVLLAITLISVAIFWTVCWRQQKERLARKIQLHVMYQQRLQQQNGGVFQHFGQQFHPLHEAAVRSAIEMLQNYGGVNGGSNFNPFGEPPRCWTQSEVQQQSGNVRPHPDDRPEHLPPPPPYPHQRKRLHFSPEFFEPELMAQPPPVAEEFLLELRRMIDVAKGRIRNRRYLPSLDEIPEEEQTSASRRSSVSKKPPSANVVHSMNELNIAFPNDLCDLKEEAEEGAETFGDVAESSPSSSRSSPKESGDKSPGSDDSGFDGDDENKVAYWLSRLPPSIEIDEGLAGEAGSFEHNDPPSQHHFRPTVNPVFVDKLKYDIAPFSDDTQLTVGQPLVYQAPNGTLIPAFNHPDFRHRCHSLPVTKLVDKSSDAANCMWMQHPHLISQTGRPVFLTQSTSGAETLPRSFLNHLLPHMSHRIFAHDHRQHSPYVHSLHRGRVNNRSPLLPAVFSLNPSSHLYTNNIDDKSDKV